MVLKKFKKVLVLQPKKVLAALSQGQVLAESFYKMNRKTTFLSKFKDVAFSLAGGFPNNTKQV
jgi:hypothetical protein